MGFQAKPRKRFGQHWLRSDVILQKIVAAAALSPADAVLEIGPGTGALTGQLLTQAGTVTAVEVDRDLCTALRSRYAGRDQFLLLEGDILRLDWRAAIAAQQRPQPNKVVANIPYYITGPILERLLGTIAQPNPNPFDAIVLLVQREVADRLCATPDSKTFGALTVKVQYLADCELVCPVPAKAFHPPPKVESAVICLRPRPHPAIAQDPNHLQQLVNLGFASKRKMLRNNLASILDRDALFDLFRSLQIPETVRAENLSIENWVALSNKMLEDAHGV